MITGIRATKLKKLRDNFKYKEIKEIGLEISRVLLFIIQSAKRGRIYAII